MLRLVCVTQRTRSQFVEESPLALSLKAQQVSDRFEIQLFFSPALHVSQHYNEAIEQVGEGALTLVFVRDDVSFCDHYWVDRIEEGLEHFDVLGVAGNRRLLPGQPSWAFVSSGFEWDDRANLCGAIAYGNRFPFKVSRYGPQKQACEVLDGALLAVRSDVLKQHKLRFDGQFNQYFFDLDFCRQARLAGLRLGVWPVAIAREQASDFGSPGWKFSYQRYLEKYREARR